MTTIFWITFWVWFSGTLIFGGVAAFRFFMNRDLLQHFGNQDGEIRAMAVASHHFRTAYLWPVHLSKVVVSLFRSITTFKEPTP